MPFLIFNLELLRSPTIHDPPAPIPPEPVGAQPCLHVEDSMVRGKLSTVITATDDSLAMVSAPVCENSPTDPVIVEPTE